MKKKLLALTLVLAITGGIFAGCAKKETAANPAPSGEKPAAGESAAKEPEAPKAQETKEITVAIALSEEEWKVMRDVVFKDFEAATGIKVNGIQVENEDIDGKMESLHQAGKAEIDVIAPDNMRLANLVEKGLVKDLSEYESKIPAEIFKNLYEDFKVDGKLYYMPFRPNVQIAFYNENKFNEYGLKAPTNWDELLNVAKTFYEKEKVGRVALQGNMGAATTVTLFEFIRSAGGDPLVLNDEGSIKAFTFLNQLAPYLSAETKRANFNVINQIMANESVYYGANWPFGVNVIVKDGGKKEVKVNEGIAGPEGINKVLGGNVAAISSDSKNSEAAMQFIEFLMSKEVQEVFVKQIAWASARSDAYGSVEEWQKPYFDAVNEAMKYATIRPIVPYWSEVDKAINEAFGEIVLNGNSDVKGVLDKQHEAIEAAKTK